MKALISKIERLKNSDIKKQIDKRLQEFSIVNKKGNTEWFSELCFCLLTANTSAELGLRMQQEFGYEGFTEYKNEAHLAKKLKDARYRFYNRRAHFICLANAYKNIKDILAKQDDKRAWLVNNIKGIGYKEASHFLRNVGILDHAILDKHIVNLMDEEGVIVRPRTMNAKHYIDIETKFNEIAQTTGIKPGELDLYMWYMKTGKVLK